jgi:hypothetical protein
MIWVLCGLVRNGIKRMRKIWEDYFPCVIKMKVATKVFLEEERCVCDIGKWLMDSHGYLLVFFYLKYEREIGGIVHIMIIKFCCAYKLVLCFFHRIKNIIHNLW